MSTNGRRGDWIQTYSGRAFWPLDPRPEDIDLVDIAHHLSNKCRYQGATKTFYSVIEHSCHIAAYFGAQLHWRPSVRRRRARLALFHESGETYLPDVPRPIKQEMPFFCEAEDRIQAMAMAKFGIAADEEDWAAMHVADWRVCLDERAALLGPSPQPWGELENLEPLGVTILALPPGEAEQLFWYNLRLYGVIP